MEEKSEKDLTVKDDFVVGLTYSLHVEGELVDQATEEEPILFVQGQGQIIPGLERQIYGMALGESKDVVVAPSEAYGEVDSGAYGLVPRTEFPSEIPLDVGVALQLKDNDEDVIDAYITEVRDEDVRLDFNHPLAGKELNFSVSVVELRPATQEEIEHGHVHEGGGE